MTLQMWGDLFYSCGAAVVLAYLLALAATYGDDDDDGGPDGYQGG